MTSYFYSGATGSVDGNSRSFSGTYPVRVKKTVDDIYQEIVDMMTAEMGEDVFLYSFNKVEDSK